MFYERLIEFVENGGRLKKGVEPSYGEPFYGEYMKQYINLHFEVGDWIKITTESITYEGLILALDYSLQILASGKKVHKNRRNKKDILYRNIKKIELIRKKENSFDLSVVDPELHEWQERRKNKADEDSVFNHSKSELHRNRREKDKQKFNTVYPEVNFEKSHIIQIHDGFTLYWPFQCKKITADVYLIEGAKSPQKITCKTGTPFPNKNHYSAYNYNSKDDAASLYLYLPDKETSYHNITLLCVWSIETTISGKMETLKVVNVHCLNKVDPIIDEYNMIFLDSRVYPLLGHGDDLFTEQSSLLTAMMNQDIYFLIHHEEDEVVMIKANDTSEYDMLGLAFQVNIVLNGGDLEQLVASLCESRSISNFPIEVFCNIDDSVERYYSSSWRYCRKKYDFQMLK